MSDRPVLVTDASVIAKWYLQDEESPDEALALRSAFSEGRFSIFMPDLARYEVANAVFVAQWRGRITRERAGQALADFVSWGFVLVGTDELLLGALDAASRFGCSLYDAAYAALAEQLGCDLVTADRRLARKLQPLAPWVKWLGDVSAHLSILHTGA